MNLIKDQWIPVKRADGTVCRIAPWEIGISDNPVVEISAPRPDFRGALYQFLIGLVQTAFAPEDDDEWVERWDNPPSCQVLKDAFEKFSEAFELVNENGPAFMQDYDLPAKAEPTPIRALLIDSPGANSVKNNTDHFVKRNAINFLCEGCTAIALLTLQINAPSGGQGHRTGLRGGGPLTTLVVPENRPKGLWSIIWLNVLATLEEFESLPNAPEQNVFPWLGPTRESSGDKKTYPADVNFLQQFWPMPRRIRIDCDTKQQYCDICGVESFCFSIINSTNYGVSYSSTWKHVLSPYRVQIEKDSTTSMLAMKGKQGGFTYVDWMALTIGFEESEIPAAVVRSALATKVFSSAKIGNLQTWCFGFDMDNMKARCWYDQIMPLVLLSPGKKDTFIEVVQKMIEAADSTSKLLRDNVKAAWFERPKDASGDTSFINSTFWQETELPFFIQIERLRTALEADRSIDAIMADWRTIIINAAEKIFDRFALQPTDEIKNMKRIVMASQSLTNSLHSIKNKSLNALKEVL